MFDHFSAVTATVCALSALSSVAAQTPLTTVRVASGLNRPVCLASPPGDYDRVFVAELDSGLVKVFESGKALSRPYLDLGKKIINDRSQGLQSFAFHPDYANNGYFFVNYTRKGDGAVVIERYSCSRDPNRADPGSALKILEIAQPFYNHNGGTLAFGPDGFLYVGMGDGGSFGDPFCSAQKPSSMLGKMLRIDVDRGSPYAIPDDNPYANSSVYLKEIWATGLRNPWRFSFDRQTGDMFIGDVGENEREELNFQPAISKGGENYGWKIAEGQLCYNRTGCAASVPQCAAAVLTKPVLDYRITQTECSIIGGHVYRGCGIPDLQGQYIFGDYCTGKLLSLAMKNGKVDTIVDRTTELAPGNGMAIDQISSFGEDACGEIYILDIKDGEVYKIVAKAPLPAVDLGFGKVGGNGEKPVFEACGLLTHGSSALFRLRKGPGNTAAVLILSATQKATNLWFGTLVPELPVMSVPFRTNPKGQLEFRVGGGHGLPSDAFGQMVLLDSGAQAGIGLSNALKITLQKTQR